MRHILPIFSDIALSERTNLFIQIFQPFSIDVKTNKKPT